MHTITRVMAPLTETQGNTLSSCLSSSGPPAPAPTSIASVGSCSKSTAFVDTHAHAAPRVNCAISVRHYEHCVVDREHCAGGESSHGATFTSFKGHTDDVAVMENRSFRGMVFSVY